MVALFFKNSCSIPLFSVKWCGRQKGAKDMDFEQLRRAEFNQQYITSMRPVLNRRGLFTDTTEHYVTPAEPAPYDLVRIRFRTSVNNVDRVFFVVFSLGDRVLFQVLFGHGSILL